MVHLQRRESGRAHGLPSAHCGPNPFAEHAIVPHVLRWKANCSRRCCEGPPTALGGSSTPACAATVLQQCTELRPPAVTLKALGCSLCSGCSAAQCAIVRLGCELT